jgi:hypothetical protein
MSKLPASELRCFYPRNIYIAVYLLITYLLYQNAEFININLTTNYNRRTLEDECVMMFNWSRMKMSSDWLYVCMCPQPQRHLYRTCLAECNPPSPIHQSIPQCKTQSKKQTLDPEQTPKTQKKKKLKHLYYPNLYGKKIRHVSSYIIIHLIDRHVCVFARGLRAVASRF